MCVTKALRVQLFSFAVLSLLTFGLHSQVIFQESFNGANGTTSGTANGVNWSSSCPTCLSGDYWEIRSGVFEARDTNGEAEWITDTPIDVSNCTYVEISFNIQSVGTMEACGTGCNSADWVLFQYNIDATGWTNPGNSYFCGGSCAGINVVASDDVGSITYSTGCIPVTGNGLRLRIAAQCWAAAEYWRIDNVTVTCSSPDAGTNGTLSVCPSDAPTNLFDELGGTPATGGTWSGPSNLTGGDQGTFDPATMNPGTYTYTVGTAPCQASAEVVVTSSGANAGTNGTMSINCGPTTDDLFPYLGGTPDPGGVWTGPSPIPANDPDGNFDPLTMLAGTYTYTVGNTPCQASSTVTVTIVNANDAGTNGTIDICANSTPVQLLNALGGTPDNGGTWAGPSPLSGGDLGTFDPATMTPGTYTYTVGTVPCEVSASVTVAVFPVGNPGSDATVDVCTNSAILNLFDQLGATPDNGGTWTGPSALTGGDLGTFDPATMTPGVYTYTIGTAPCDTSASVTVNDLPLGNPGTTTSINTCGNAAAINLLTQLGNADNGGTWTGPSVLTGGDLGTFDPGTMNSGTYTYTLGTAPCDVSASVTVTVLTLDDPAFSISDYCENTNPTITVTGLPGGTFDFNPVPADGATINPATGDITGGVGGTSYTIQYGTNGQCPQTSTQPVNVLPLPNLTVNDFSMCEGDSVELTANGAVSYTWDNNLGTGQSHMVFPTATTTYTVTGTNALGCENSGQSMVTVHALPAVNAGVDQTVCEGDAVILNANGAVLYNWTNGITNGVPFTPTGNATYIVAGEDANGCQNTDTVVVNVESLPAPSFFSDDLIGCVSFTTSFYNNTNGTFANCHWIINGEILADCDSVDYTFEDPGLYDITLTLESLNGCIGSSTYADYISVEQQPVANFSFTQAQVSTNSSEVSFNNQSIGAVTYVWQLGDGNQTTVFEPTHTYDFTDSLSYTVTLIATSANGCVDSVQQTIPKTESLLYYVPNAFTPDGDEFNNTFTPVFTEGFDPYNYHLYIYNRWGELIFESQDPAIGWDGSSMGRMQMNDLYTWKIDFKRRNSDEHITTLGHVNLLR